MILMAMDRAPGSVRSYDADGRLHVAISNISKANVCPYYGREIPGWTELGLDGDRVYNLLRDPEELARAAPTFNNLPVLSDHIPVSAWDEESHHPSLVVGSTGTDGVFDGQYLTNSLSVWARRSIDGIASDEKREISSAYRYRADMTPGNYNGVAYDGIMRDIIGNHVALVFEGRAGSDVLIGDEKPMALKSKRALLLAGGLSGLIRPLLAQDAKFDISRSLDGVTDASLTPAGAAQALADRVFGEVQPMLAADSALTVAQVVGVVNAVATLALDEDPEEPATAEDEDPDVAEDEDPEEEAPAMDSAAVNAKIAKAVGKVKAEAAAYRIAEREVQPIVGELTAMDSAADIYRIGLETLGVDHAKLPDAALAETFRAVKAVKDTAPRPLVAQDSRSVSDFNKRYENRTTLVRG